MNITEIELTFLKKIKEAIEEVNGNKVKVTLLKKIASQSIDIALGKKEYSGLSHASISAKFSGRGRAWAKVDSDCTSIWNIIKDTLCTSKLSKNYVSYLNLFDLFEETGFAWMRYSNCKNSNMVFDLRFNGSKLEDSIKCYIPLVYIDKIKNLDGVPHKIGLETGVFSLNKEEKVKVEENIVTQEELMSFGIQTIDSLM
tara:strand:- start:1149 stop:1745 length:597 start_codon:yes stop_codon:yes gene_type:complete